jgi:dTDP-glucose pyrophosphorylase
MKAIILAAGKGVRMKELTKDTPKPLLKVKGKAVLERNLEQILGLVEEVIIVVGHKKEKIMAAFGTDYNGLKITYVIQKKQLGTGDALKSVNDYDSGVLKERFLLLMGDDIFFREDIENCLKHKNAILAKKVEDPSRFGVFIVKKGLIKEVIEKPKKFVSDLVNVALYVFDGIEMKGISLSERGEIEFTDLVDDIVKERDVHCVIAKKWISIATPEDLKKAEGLLK